MKKRFGAIAETVAVFLGGAVIWYGFIASKNEVDCLFSLLHLHGCG